MRRLRFISIFAAFLLAGAYLGFGFSLYHELVDINGRCTRHRVNRPDNFTDLGNFWPDGFAYAPYFMPTYELVHFPSRQPGIELAAWYIEAAPDAPTVVIIHGFGSCKHAHTELVPAGMLHQAGFSVLVLDLRDAGDSTLEDGRSTLGTEEYWDVLGGWDWLVMQKGVPPTRVGLLGNSIGGVASLLAFAHEPQIAAVLADAPYTDPLLYIQAETRRNKFPQFLIPVALWWGRQLGGHNLLAYDANEVLRQAGQRKLAVFHGTGDRFVQIAHAQKLQTQAAALGVPITFWLADGVDHTRLAVDQTAEYEMRLVGFFQQALRSSNE